MDTFWNLLEQSTITSGLIAACLVLTACYCVIAGITLPEWFSLAFGLIKELGHAINIEGAALA